MCGKTREIGNGKCLENSSKITQDKCRLKALTHKQCTDVMAKILSLRNDEWTQKQIASQQPLKQIKNGV